MTTCRSSPTTDEMGRRSLPHAPTCLREQGWVRASVRESAGILLGGDAYF